MSKRSHFTPKIIKNLIYLFYHLFIYFIHFFVRHADGSIKFWDASSVGLQILYKLKTAKVRHIPLYPSASQPPPVHPRLTPVHPSLSQSIFYIFFMFREKIDNIFTFLTREILKKNLARHVCNLSL